MFYDGNSQGGILGGPVVAMSRDIHRGVLGVPGMNYSTLLTRSVDFDLYSIPLYLAYPDDLDRGFIFSMMQMLWDRSENNGYAHHIADSSALGAPGNEVLLHPAFADHQVSMWTAEVMARTVGARVDRSRVTAERHPDEVEYFGLEPLDYNKKGEQLGSALVIWDNHQQPSPPIGNVSPREGSDPHSFPRNQQVGRCQKGHFLQREGVLIAVPARDTEAGGFVCPALEPTETQPGTPPPAQLPGADPAGVAGCLLTQDPALCQAAVESLQGFQDCDFDESGINCAYEVLADAISIETAAAFVRELAAQCAASPAAPVCEAIRSGGNGALPDRLVVASRMIQRGDLIYTEADAATPSKKSVDGAIDDWMAQATRFGGTDIFEFGEHAYSDFLFDAYGADNGDDARRLAALAALGDFSDRTGRIDALQQAGGDQLDVPQPAGSAADHYGDAANREDGTDLTEVRWGADKDDLFVLARVAKLENPDNLVVVVLADQFDGEAGLDGLDAGLATAIFDRAIVLRAGGGYIFNSAAGGSPVPLTAAVSAAGYDNALEARIPRAYIERPDGSIRVSVFTARISGDSFVPANVAYRYDEPVTIYSERAQALALFAGSVDPFARSIDVAQLEHGRTQVARPGPGYHERQFTSGANISVEGDAENGRLQPYGVFVPSAIKANDAGQARMTFWTHYRGGKAHSGAAWTPRLFTQLGEEQGNIVVSPRARGTSTWYTTRAHQDFFEVFADVAGTKRLNQYAGENLPADHAFTADGLFEVDPARIYISGYSMGGYATYLFGGLYPDLFAGGYSTSGAVTQGAWTGIGPNPGDPGHDETCGYTAPDDMPEVGGGSPCFIEANSGRANAQLNYRLLENTRYVPIVIHHGSNDELALTPGAERMGQRLAELQYRYDMTTFLGYEHFTQAIVDEWADGARYLNLHERPANPRLVTYQLVPALVKAVNEVQLNGVNGNQPFNFHPDGAYWVDDLAVRDDDGAPHVAGRIDAESGRLAGQSHQAVPRTGTEASASDPYFSTPVFSPGQHSTPYVRHSMEWLPLGEVAGDANTFSARLANLSHARLDLSRMGFDGHFDEPIDGSVSSDGAATLVLANVGAAMTACVNNVAAGNVAAGSDAVFSLAAGDSSVRLLPGTDASCAGTPPPPPAEGFPLCEPVSGEYCISDIPVIGPVIQGAVDTIYAAVTGGGDPGEVPPEVQQLAQDPVDPLLVDCTGPAGDPAEGTPEFAQRDAENIFCTMQRHQDSLAQPANNPYMMENYGADPYRAPARHAGKRFRHAEIDIAGVDAQEGMSFHPGASSNAEIYMPCAEGTCEGMPEGLRTFEPPYPIAIVMHGAASDKKHLEWVTQPLAERGYFVLTANGTGNGLPGVLLNWLFDPANPYADQLDLSRIGTAGHSLGAENATRVQGDARVSGIVAFDPCDGSGGNECRDSSGSRLHDKGAAAQTPTLFLTADYLGFPGYPEPQASVPGDLRVEGFGILRDNGVDTMLVTPRATTHLDWAGAFTFGNRLNEATSLHYTLAWFDRYVNGKLVVDGAGNVATSNGRTVAEERAHRQAIVDSAFARLTASSFDGIVDLHNISQGRWDRLKAIESGDMEYGGNVPYRVTGLDLKDRVSFYHRSVCSITRPSFVSGAPLARADTGMDGDMRRTGCALAQPPGASLRSLVGSIHEHSGFSDGEIATTPADYFQAGIDNGLDFMAGTEHSDNAMAPVTANADCVSADFADCFQASPDGVQKWQASARIADAKNRPGAFSAIRGFEWTSDRFGHINVLFSQNDLNAKTSTGYAASMEDFWQWLALPPSRMGGADGLAVFNHPGREVDVEDGLSQAGLGGDPAYTWNDFDYRPEHDARVVGIEMYGKSGDYYDTDNGAPAGGWLARALDKGWHVAPVGAEDEHGREWAKPKRAKTVVLAADNTREAIRAAMLERRFYALSHGHGDVRVSFTSGGNLMGSRLVGAAGTGLAFDVEVEDTAPASIAAARIEVVGPGGAVVSSADGLSHAFTATIGATEQWRFVRVLDASGNVLAVSAPIWFKPSAQAN